MKVIKRDGTIVEFDKMKIRLAIEAANKEIKESGRASDEEIDEIISFIESLGKKRILVEDIQDIIEEKLMDYKHFELAKKYIVYRYTRALVRKQNTTDESILGLIKKKLRHPSANYYNFITALFLVYKNKIILRGVIIIKTKVKLFLVCLHNKFFYIF